MKIQLVNATLTAGYYRLFFQSQGGKTPPPFAPMEKNDYNCSPPKVHIYESFNQGTKIYYCIDVAKRL